MPLPETVEFLGVGPRELPNSGDVRMWVDAGSGFTGQRILVNVKDLRLAEQDDGRGTSAIYVISRHRG